MNKILITGIVAIGLVVLTGIFFSPDVQVNVPESSCPECSYGSIPGNSIAAESIIVNDVETMFPRKDFTYSTSTVACAIRNTNATSTLRFLAFQITTASSTSALYFSIGTTTKTFPGAFSTSSSLVSSVTLPAAVKKGYSYYPTILDNTIIGANEWITIGYTTGDKDVDAIDIPSLVRGTCQAELRVIGR